jgi:hypothetical protein
MPRCHHEVIVRDLTVIERLQVREIDRSIPAGTLSTPRQHIYASGVDEPLARGGLPLRLNRILNYHDGTKRPTTLIWLQHTVGLNTYVTHDHTPHNVPVQRRRDEMSSAPRAHSEMTRFRRARDAVRPVRCNCLLAATAPVK